MSLRLALCAVWTAIVFVGAVSASYYAWSPYSDDERPAAGARGFHGPTHK